MPVRMPVRTPAHMPAHMPVAENENRDKHADKTPGGDCENVPKVILGAWRLAAANGDGRNEDSEAAHGQELYQICNN